jgi:hypothetical protein
MVPVPDAKVELRPRSCGRGKVHCVSTPTVTTSTSNRTTSAADLCDACAHDADGHDPIARRFCAATVAGALSRTCICGKR